MQPNQNTTHHPPQPWNQQPNEPDNHYREFTQWLHTTTGPTNTRNLKTYPSPNNYTPDYRKEISARHQWTTRAAAWDNRHLETSLQDHHNHRTKIHHIHQQTTQQLATLAQQTINTINPDDLTNKEKLELLKITNTWIETNLTHTTTTGTETNTIRQITDPNGTLNLIIAEHQRRLSKKD